LEWDKPQALPSVIAVIEYTVTAMNYLQFSMLLSHQDVLGSFWCCDVAYLLAMVVPGASI
jgi:hypothetical protein